MPTPSPEPPFRAAFARWSNRVRFRLGLRHVLSGAALGLVAGALGTAAAWHFRQGDLRPFGAAFGAAGALAGFALARRKRWPDGDVALYLDARLDSHETIATAIELDTRPSRTSGVDDEARAVVLGQAGRALEAAEAKKIRPRVLTAAHALLPLAAGAIVALAVLPLPPAPPAAAAPPGGDKVRMADLEGLEKVIHLGEIDARDPAQKERLKKLAEDAKKLREKLKQGMEKREAQAELAKLRDGITAERLSLGDGEQRAGLESALSKLGEDPRLKNAQKALGDRDLISFDQEMERLANKLEKEDRNRAQKILEEAAEAAKKNGAPDVAKELQKQKERMKERGEKAEKLRALAKELGEALGKEGHEALEGWNESGSGKDQKRLQEKLEEALGKLSPEERKRLAENLKKKIAEAPEEGLGGVTKKQLRELAEQLETPEGQKRLEEELRKMAEDAESKRQRELDDAQKGLGQAEGKLGAPIPIPIDGPGQGGKNPGGQPNANKDGKPSPGHSEDGPGKSDHKGMTGVVEGGEFKSRANAKINKGTPMPGVVMGRSAGKAGETANLAGQGALGQAGPGEVNGVERSDIPEEYREQVGRYFQPK